MLGASRPNIDAREEPVEAELEVEEAAVETRLLPTIEVLSWGAGRQQVKA
jgi:hypothetical protein